MTASARTALLNIGSLAQGKAVHHVDRDAIAELQSLGLIGPKGGLTRRGSIKREQILEAELEASFG